MKKHFELIFVFTVFSLALLVAVLIAPAQDGQPVFVYPPVMAFLLLFLLFLVLVLSVRKAVERLYTEHIPEREKAIYLAEKEKKSIKNIEDVFRILTKSKPISQESEIVSSHGFDGIYELDNDLPPWWLYGFYISIAFSAFYLLYYHFLGGQTQKQEYIAEVALAKKQMERYLQNAKIVDVNSLELSDDEASLRKGKKLFKANCAVCHGVDGGGLIGPNLTDEYWILGGGIKNIFRVISQGGRDGKGMIAWKNSLSAEKMQLLANYVLNLNGSTPKKPKAPEGEKWIAPKE